LLEYAEDVDEDMLANVANSFSASEDVVDDEPSFDDGPSAGAADTPDDMVLDDSAAQALAAIGLDQLLNW
jgi:hypothetical protein